MRASRQVNDIADIGLIDQISDEDYKRAALCLADIAVRLNASGDLPEILRMIGYTRE